MEDECALPLRPYILANGFSNLSKPSCSKCRSVVRASLKPKRSINKKLTASHSEYLLSRRAPEQVECFSVQFFVNPCHRYVGIAGDVLNKRECDLSVQFSCVCQCDELPARDVIVRHAALVEEEEKSVTALECNASSASIRQYKPDVSASIRCSLLIHRILCLDPRRFARCCWHWGCDRGEGSNVTSPLTRLGTFCCIANIWIGRDDNLCTFSLAQLRKLKLNHATGLHRHGLPDCHIRQVYRQN